MESGNAAGPRSVGILTRWNADGWVAFITHVGGRGTEDDTRVAELSPGGGAAVRRLWESGLIFHLLSLRGFSHS